ncbi:MAG: GIY-YIG nuclease family protein [Hyphomicrobiaceae bacterium]|nr:GIY-YIG nuclease family protein [Hyphomicrobiaceae bacterium]
MPSDPATDAGEAPTYFVYILGCADGTLYTGIARDVEKRLAEHNGARAGGARYTAARRPVRLVYQAPCAGRAAAQREEARIKALTRAEKEALLRARALQA